MGLLGGTATMSPPNLGVHRMRRTSALAVAFLAAALSACVSTQTHVAGPAPRWAAGDDDHDGVPNAVDACPGSLPGQAIVRGGCTQPPEGPRPDIYFLPGSAELDARAKTTLDENIKLLTSVARQAQFEIVGHSDSCGSPTYKQRLSELRAQAVERYMLASRVASSQIRRVYGVSDSKPLLPPNSAECSVERDRRVDLDFAGWRLHP